MVLVACGWMGCWLGPFRYTHLWKIFLGLHSTPKKHVHRLDAGQLHRISSTANLWMWIRTLGLCWRLSCLTLVVFYWSCCSRISESGMLGFSVLMNSMVRILELFLCKEGGKTSVCFNLPPRSAIVSKLRGKEGDFVNWLGVKCSSWVSICRGTSHRSIVNPLGNEDAEFVQEGNMMASRYLTWPLKWLWLL